MRHFEFTIAGPPLSHQSRNKTRLQAWREMVRNAAIERWGTEDGWRHPLRIIVTYYHEGPAIRMDNDNMLKPIQDALIGVVYEDDRQITDTSVRKTNIDGEFRVRGASLVLLEAFAHGREFLHVVIQDAPQHTQFLE